MDFLEKWQKKSELRGKIRELQSQIRELQSEIRELNQLISDYNACKQDIDEVINNWVTQRTTYQNILLEPVKVESYFEGTSAENIKSRLVTTIASMNNANVTMTTIKCAIPNQIELIEDKITILEAQVTVLEAQVEALEAELAALG